jgi:hypothetical protein
MPQLETGYDDDGGGDTDAPACDEWDLALRVRLCCGRSKREPRRLGRRREELSGIIIVVVVESNDRNEGARGNRARAPAWPACTSGTCSSARCLRD